MRYNQITIIILVRLKC
uniref:Uncharacterized protein n=1 Tax=Arundo donax TaxID=35708 RepID=A0A0A9AED1_ARUDO